MIVLISRIPIPRTKRALRLRLPTSCRCASRPQVCCQSCAGTKPSRCYRAEFPLRGVPTLLAPILQRAVRGHHSTETSDLKSRPAISPTGPEPTAKAHTHMNSFQNSQHPSCSIGALPVKSRKSLRHRASDFTPSSSRGASNGYETASSQKSVCDDRFRLRIVGSVMKMKSPSHRLSSFRPPALSASFGLSFAA